MLRGRGKCQTINDIEWSDEVDSDSEVEARGKKRRRVSDSEEEFTPKKCIDSPKEFSKRKTKTRITPRRQAKCSTTTSKKRSTPSPRTKLNLNVLDDDSELMSKYEYSPVPPVKRRATTFERELTDRDHSTPTAPTSANIDYDSQVPDDDLTMKEVASGVLLGSTLNPLQASEHRYDAEDPSTATAKPPNRHHSEQSNHGLLEGGWGRLLGRPLPTLMG